MESKIRLKIGPVEVDFEGTEDYIKNSLPALIDQLLEKVPLESAVAHPEEEVLLPEPHDTSKRKLELTTNTIAAKLGVKSASELIMATCAHLALVKGADSFLRANITAEMKTASNYFRQTYVNNLSKSLSTLVKSGKLIERSQDTYALSAGALQELEAKLKA